jgi:hypothetical protein
MTTRAEVLSASVREPSPEASGDGPSDGDSSRVGGSEPAPPRGKPGWVWWVAGAFVVMLGVGGFRLWRSMPAPETTANDEPEG